MKERPILFSGAMVRALLAGTKTQTRRVVKPQPTGFVGGPGVTLCDSSPAPLVPMNDFAGTCGQEIICPYGQPGDRLWVRETWRIGSWDDGCGFWIDYRDGPRKERLECPDVDLAYRLIEQTGEDLRKRNIQPTNGTMYEWTPGQSPLRWRPSIHMPRWASRITLEITSVRVERLQSISASDAIAEGVNVHPDHHDKPRASIYGPVQAYRDLWEQINGPGSWDVDPWVWRLEFKRVMTGLSHG